MISLTLKKEPDYIPYQNRSLSVSVRPFGEKERNLGPYGLVKVLTALYDIRPFNLISLRRADNAESSFTAEISVPDAEEAKAELKRICASEKMILRTGRVSPERMMTFRDTSQILDFLFISAPENKTAASPLACIRNENGTIYLDYSFRTGAGTDVRIRKLTGLAKRTGFTMEG